jgi:hypothetical protein
MILAHLLGGCAFVVSTAAFQLSDRKQHSHFRRSSLKGFPTWHHLAVGQMSITLACVFCVNRDTNSGSKASGKQTAVIPVRWLGWQKRMARHLLGLTKIYDYKQPIGELEPYWWSVEGENIWDELLDAAFPE